MIFHEEEDESIWHWSAPAGERNPAKMELRDKHKTVMVFPFRKLSALLENPVFAGRRKVESCSFTPPSAAKPVWGVGCAAETDPVSVPSSHLLHERHVYAIFTYKTLKQFYKKEWHWRSSFPIYAPKIDIHTEHCCGGWQSPILCILKKKDGLPSRGYNESKISSCRHDTIPESQ